MNYKIQKIFIFICLFFVVSCDSFFTRFSHLNFECKKNIFNIEKIWITKKLQGLSANLVMNNMKYAIKEVEENNDKIILGLNEQQLKIEISNIDDTILVIKNNKLINLTCKKSYFKM